MRQKVVHWVFITLTTLIAHPVVPHTQRWRLYRLIGMDVGRCHVSARLDLPNRLVSIGPGARVNRGVLMEGRGGITIGRNVSLGPRTCIATSRHQIGTTDRRAGLNQPLAVTVGDGAWVGMGATILPGVTIGAAAVVAAGAVVTRDVPPSTLVAGVPATVVRELP